MMKRFWVNVSRVCCAGRIYFFGWPQSILLGCYYSSGIAIVAVQATTPYNVVQMHHVGTSSRGCYVDWCGRCGRCGRI